MKRRLILVAVMCVVFAIAVGYAATRPGPRPFDTGPNYVESPTP